MRIYNILFLAGAILTVITVWTFIGINLVASTVENHKRREDMTRKARLVRMVGFIISVILLVVGALGNAHVFERL